MSRVTRSQSTCFPSPYLPVELWAEIISYLPRYILKSLFIFHPHPLGKIASHVYFSTLSLHFSIFHDHKRYADMYRSCCESNDEWLKWHDELVKWHNKRSCDILMTIMRSDFGNRIQKLRIYAGSDGQTDTLALQIDLLVSAIPKLTRLKILECNGSKPLFMAIASSLATLPHLKTLRLSSLCIQTVTPPTDQWIHLPPRLNQLTLCEDWEDHFSVDNLPNSSVKNLHVTSDNSDRIMRRIVSNPPFMKSLTHLSWVFDDAIDSSCSISIFEIALQYCANLKCLRVRGPLTSPHSQYFRQCIGNGTLPEALPYLTEFGIYVTSCHSDPDFFPAVCDFIKPKVARLIHLELGSPGSKAAQDKLGYEGGRGCWALLENTSHCRMQELRSFPLESLSMPLPAGKTLFGLHYSRLIPRGVTRLSLSGHDLPQNSIRQIFKVSRSKKRGPRWPPNLRLVCIHININSEHLHEPAWEWENTLVDLLAKSIPAIRVVKIMDSYRNVYNFWSTDLKNIPAKECVDGAWPIPSYVKRMQWDSRQGTVMRNEMLERHDCEDTWFEEG